MAVTLHDVARAAGVSIKTVSNVINGYPYIRDTTKERVLAAVDELGYRPNSSARTLRSGRSGMISLIVPNLRNPYFAELADEVMTVASARGLSVVIEVFAGDRDSELAALRSAERQAVDGVLYSGLVLGGADAATLDRVRVPVVLLGERVPGSTRDHITMDSEQGARAATSHLLETGRRRVLALGTHPDDHEGTPSLRLAGYRAALRDKGIDEDPELQVPVDLWHRVDGAAAMRTVLHRGTSFDGVFAFNDSLALGALRVLLEAGVRVPADVAVIGFDDLDETRYSLPALSTVDPGRAELARTAVDLLVARIEGTAPRDPVDALAGYAVVPRESTAV